MSSVIHYKFRSSKDFDTYRFEGAGVPVWQLKEEIIAAKRLVTTTGSSSGDFDLIVCNAQTNTDYKDDAQIIPRNTSVSVRRVPAPPGTQKAKKPTPIQPQSKLAATTVGANTVNNGASKDLTPDDIKVQKLIQQEAVIFERSSTQQASVQQRRPQMTFKPRPNMAASSAVPPPNYICFRCGLKGHFINFCPTNNDPSFDKPRIKRTTGIPRAFLKLVEGTAMDARAADPTATIMVTPQGQTVIAQANETEWNRLVSSRSLPGGEGDDNENKLIPEHLQCANGGHLLSHAPITPGCCGAHYCETCLHSIKNCLNCKRSFGPNSSWLVDFKLKLKLDEYLGNCSAHSSIVSNERKNSDTFEYKGGESASSVKRSRRSQNTRSRSRSPLGQRPRHRR